jgi:hypothetical protein
MFMDMLSKTIPRSWRAAIALLVTLLAFGRGLSAIQVLVVPDSDKSGLFVSILALIIGIVAMIAFFYFQSIDGEPKKYNELETLNKYYQREQHKQAIAKPVFSSHEGEIKPKATNKTKTPKLS